MVHVLSNRSSYSGSMVGLIRGSGKSSGGVSSSAVDTSCRGATPYATRGLPSKSGSASLDTSTSSMLVITNELMAWFNGSIFDPKIG